MIVLLKGQVIVSVRTVPFYTHTHIYIYIYICMCVYLSMIFS